MVMKQALFPDGFDIYTSDLEFIQDTLEAEVQDRMKHVTLTGGVASGLGVTPGNDKITVADGEAYTELERELIRYIAGPEDIAVDAAADLNKWLVIFNVVSLSTVDSHPITGVADFRRQILTPSLALTATPLSSQVKLCKITGTSAGNPPTLDTDPPERELLSLGIGASGSATNPFVVVASDGTGDFTTLQAGIDSLPSGGGMVYVKHGTYALTSRVTITDSNVRILGSGDGTLVTMTAADSIMIDVDGTGPGVGNISLESMRFDWAGDPGGGQNNAAIRALDAANVSIRRCTFENSGAATAPIGVWIADGSEAVRVINCFSPTTNGINIGVLGEPSASAVNCIVRGCTFRAVSWGVRGRAGCDNWAIHSNIFDGGSGVAGIEVDDCTDWAIADNIIQSVFTSGISILSTVATVGMCITGNLSTGHTNGLFIAASADRTVYDGNNFRNNGTPISGTGTNFVAGNNITT